MNSFSIKKSPLKFLSIMVVAGIFGIFVIRQDGVSASQQASSDDAEVLVTVNLPEGEIPEGTIIVMLEDITLQDVPSVEIARTEVPAKSIEDNRVEISVPVDLKLVSPEATINAAVIIDVDNSGSVSAGDLISDALAPVINNSSMEVNVGVVKVSG